jgi:hypothetical protein
MKDEGTDKAVTENERLATMGALSPCSLWQKGSCFSSRTFAAFALNAFRS